MPGVPGDLIPPVVAPQLPQRPDDDPPPGVDPSILTPQVYCRLLDGSIGLNRQRYNHHQQESRKLCSSGVHAYHCVWPP